MVPEMRCASALAPAVSEVYILHARASMLHMACACEYEPWSERCWRLRARPLQLLALLFCVCVYVLFTLFGIVELSNLSMCICPLRLALHSSYLIYSHGRRHCDIYIYTHVPKTVACFTCVLILCVGTRLSCTCLPFHTVASMASSVKLVAVLAG